MTFISVADTLHTVCVVISVTSKADTFLTICMAHKKKTLYLNQITICMCCVPVLIVIKVFLNAGNFFLTTFKTDLIKSNQLNNS